MLSDAASAQNSSKLQNKLLKEAEAETPDLSVESHSSANALQEFKIVNNNYNAINSDSNQEKKRSFNFRRPYQFKTRDLFAEK